MHDPKETLENSNEETEENLYPYYLHKLPKSKQWLYTSLYIQKEKKLSTYRACRIFGWHHAYLGNWMFQVGFILLMAISWYYMADFIAMWWVPIVWWLLDAFRAEEVVNKYNNDLAWELYGMIKI